MNLKNMKNPQLKGRDSKVVRLIRNKTLFKKQKKKKKKKLKGLKSAYYQSLVNKT